MKAAKARKPRNTATTKPAAVVPLTRRPSREELTASIEPPALTLDDILIVAKYPHRPDGIGTGEGQERPVLTGADLANVVDFCIQSGGVFPMADDGSVNIELRGLASLISGHCDDGGENRLDENAALFVERTLKSFAARLEASNRVDQFSVVLRAKSAAGKEQAS